MCAAGHTAREIAAAMGVTRSSVLGVCHRQNILLARSIGNPNGLCRSGLAPGRRRPARVKAIVKRPVAEHPVEFYLQTAVPIEGLAKTGCRWPVSEEAPFLFCNHPATHNCYCDDHAVKAYQTSHTQQRGTAA